MSLNLFPYSLEPPRPRCRYCNRLCPKGYSATCGRSECQEANYREHVARTHRSRR